MHEVKFKAWHKLAKKICDIDALDWMLDAYRAHAGKRSGSGHLADIILLQYIGLKDKHGKEIYEGSIVKADWHWEEPHALSWPADCYDLVEYSIETHVHLEVIGNIFEDAHLLEHTK